MPASYSQFLLHVVDECFSAYRQGLRPTLFAPRTDYVLPGVSVRWVGLRVSVRRSETNNREHATAV